MARKSNNASKLKSEAEEANWYATAEGRRQTQREFTRALRTGALSRSRGLNVTKSDPRILEQLMEQAKAIATRAISLRVPVADLERAKQIADRTGVGYQTVLKQAIHRGLQKAS
jgi:hypothetical protein